MHAFVFLLGPVVIRHSHDLIAKKNASVGRRAILCSLSVLALLEVFLKNEGAMDASCSLG